MTIKEMLKNKKAILFDLDGTILDDSNVWNKIYIELIKQECNIEISIEQINQDWHDHLKLFNNNDFYKSYVLYLINKYSKIKKELNADKLREKLYTIADNYICNLVEYKPFAPEVIKKLKEKGYKLGLGSISDRETFKKYNYSNPNIRNKMNLIDYFDRIVLYEDVANKKPNPEVYMKLLKELNLKPEECLIIEDSLSGIQAAINAKIDVLNIPDKGSLNNQNKINNLADYKVDNLKILLDILEEI